MFIRRFLCARTINFVRFYVADCSKKLPQATFSIKGDSGTSDIAGATLPKCCRIFDAIGSTEEVQSYIGLAREFALESGHDYGDKLKRAQTVLVDIVRVISNSNEKHVQSISDMYTKELEDWINEYSSQLPPAEEFIIPGGGLASATLHVARSVCRRAERQVVGLVISGVVDQEVQIYMNRLSDFLFTVSRIAVKADKRTETIYTPKPINLKN